MRRRDEISANLIMVCQQCNPYGWRKQNHPAAPDREYNKRKAKGNA